MTTAAPPRGATSEIQAVVEVILYIDKHHTAPSVMGDLGRLRDGIEALREAIQDSLEAYQKERTRFVNNNPLVMAAIATYDVPEPGQKKKTLVNFQELRNRPRPQWVIEGFFYENTIIQLYAEAGCYKSFLAFDWSARIATGSEYWLGHCVKKSGVVVYIAAEGADGYVSRGDAWCAHNAIDFEILAKNFWFWPEPLPLTNSAEITHFIDEVTEELKESGQIPQLVVIDTLLRCSDGQNINSPDVMGGIFKGAETIKRELQAPNVLIVHHAGKNKQLGGMGSVVLKSNCDINYRMEKDTSVEGQVILTAEKMKDKPELTTYLRTKKVYYGSLPTEDEASLVIVAGEKPSKDNRQPKLPKSQADVLAILDEHATLTYTDWWKHYENTGGKKRTFDDAIKALGDKKITEQHEGKYQRYAQPPQGEEEEEIENG